MRVIYTTLHTFKRRLDQNRLPRRNPSLVVWDECHWGFAAATGKALLRWAKKSRIPVLGLTATPRYPERFELACSHTFGQLVEAGYLAAAELVPRRTGTDWSPMIWGEHGDFTPTSLRRLARNRSRNNLIVEEYVGNAEKYKKTVVFACDIQHAVDLARLFARKGVAARSLHSELPPSMREQTLQQFREDEIRVLVNVAMLTHGIDIPDIKTVFLCRPTASDILFSQMVGRGARRMPDKDTFYLVEFTDNADRFLPEVVTAREFLGVAMPPPPPTYTPRSWRHRYDPKGLPTWTGHDCPEPVRDLWYLEGQTFGVEFELTANVVPVYQDVPRWLPEANGLLERLRERLGDGRVRPGDAVMERHTEGYEQWKVEYDASCGWEVVSPILEGRDGFLELADACEALTAAAEELGLRVNYRTGTHVHIGWLGDRDRVVVDALRLAHLLEPVLRSLVPPSRFAAYDPDRDCYDTSKHNQYCEPIAKVYAIDGFDDETTLEDIERMGYRESDRYVTFNPQPLWECPEAPRVEVRLLGGTTETDKVLPWLSLWMRLLWAAGQDPDLSDYDLGDPSSGFPTLDIDDLLKLVAVPGESPEFVERLRRRQLEIFANWKEHEELRPWLPTRSHQRPSFIRPLPNIARFLEVFNLDNEDGTFIGLAEDARLCALWCVLLGEGPLARRDRATVELCALRLLNEGWADYSGLDERDKLYEAIQNTLDRASCDGTDGWFDAPCAGQLRAFAKVESHTPSPANCVLDEGDWRDCVMRAMSRQPDGLAWCPRAGRAAFEVARKYYGIQFKNYVDTVKEPIYEAIDVAVDAGDLSLQRGRLRLTADYVDP